MNCLSFVMTQILASIFVYIFTSTSILCNMIPNCILHVTGAAAKSKRKGRKAMDEAMHVVTESMNDTGGLGYFHVSHFCLA